MNAHRLISGNDIDDALSLATAGKQAPEPVIARLRAAVDDPALRGHDFSAAYAMVGISELQYLAGHPDAAEATLREAIAAGIRDRDSDPHAWLVVLLVDLGRLAEAKAEFHDLRAAGRADVSAYQLYGEALEERGELAAAKRIYLAGELAAERAGEPWDERRMHNAGLRVRQALGEIGPDDADDDGFAFDTEAGFDADELDVDGAPVDEDLRHRIVGQLFWPEQDYRRLLESWPEIGGWLGRDWDEHRTLVERELNALVDHVGRLVLTRGDYPEYASFVDGHGAEALDPDGMRDYAATSRHAMEHIPWPPERNAACWCGSGQKYKKCCRTRGLAA